MAKRMKMNQWLMCLIGAWLMQGCSTLDEKNEGIDYIQYQYLNNVGNDATKLYLLQATEFIFTKDSILAQVNRNITNGQVSRRPINVPYDGKWIIVTFANLNGGMRVSDYTIGQTHMRDMSLRVARQSSYTGTYADNIADVPKEKIGDSDKLYYGKVEVGVEGGKVNKVYSVKMSNIHIWINATVKWSSPLKAPARKSYENLHVRLEYVPLEYSFLSDDKKDPFYGIPYSTPRITTETATQMVPLKPLNAANEFGFQTYGMRWETGGAPVLRIYDGETALVNKELPLNKYFAEHGISLTTTRVQFYDFLIEIGDNDVVKISSKSYLDWEDGGNMEPKRN